MHSDVCGTKWVSAVVWYVPVANPKEGVTGVVALLGNWGPQKFGECQASISSQHWLIKFVRKLIGPWDKYAACLN